MPRRKKIKKTTWTDIALDKLADILNDYSSGPDQLTQERINSFFRYVPGFRPSRVTRTLNSFEKDGLIKIKESDRGPAIKIDFTPKGINRLKLLKHRRTEHKPSQWDGKYRVVSFDIPEKYRWARDAFRARIKEISFVQVQKSVWVYPYDCAELIVELCREYRIEKFVNLFTGEYVGDDRELKKIFGL